MIHVSQKKKAVMLLTSTRKSIPESSFHLAKYNSVTLLSQCCLLNHWSDVINYFVEVQNDPQTHERASHWAHARYLILLEQQDRWRDSWFSVFLSFHFLDWEIQDTPLHLSNTNTSRSSQVQPVYLRRSVFYFLGECWRSLHLFPAQWQWLIAAQINTN